MVKRIDEAYGRMIDVVKSLKLFDDSAIIFTSDHGNNFRTRTREYKRSCHESSIRVPTSFIGNMFQQGGRIKELTNILDIHATILDLGKVKNTSHCDGKSIIPLVNKTSMNWENEIFIQISESELARSLRTSKWKYCISDLTSNGNDKPSSDNYTETSLYDLDADPYELNNLIGINAYDEILNDLRKKMKRKIKKIENISIKINKGQNITNPGQLGIKPDSFHRSKKKL
jgi:arylsulfatase A-like enzyme